MLHAVPVNQIGSVRRSYQLRVVRPMHTHMLGWTTYSLHDSTLLILLRLWLLHFWLLLADGLHPSEGFVEPTSDNSTIAVHLMVACSTLRIILTASLEVGEILKGNTRGLEAVSEAGVSKDDQLTLLRAAAVDVGSADLSLLLPIEALLTASTTPPPELPDIFLPGS